MKKSIALAAVLLSLATPAVAATQGYVGSFFVVVDKDPFDDSASVIAMVMNRDGTLALRCTQQVRTLAIVTGSTLQVGDTFDVKIRADSKQVFEEKATALNDKMMEVSTDADEIFDSISGAKSVSIRVSGASSSYTFSVAAMQSAKVVDQVKKACPAKP